jgi:hypothetical protein
MGQRLGNLRIPLITLLEAYSIPAFCFVVLSTNHNVDHIFSATYPSDWNHKTCFELIIGDVGVIPFRSKQNNQTLSAMDVLAPTTMKNAAKCDTSCELQNPVSHQNFERTLHFFGSMSVGVSVLTHTKTREGFCESTSCQTNLFGVSVLR